MTMVKKLEEIGIENGGVADILLDGKKQLAFLEDFGIDLQSGKTDDYRCVVFLNNGRREFSSPVLGFSENSRTGGTSLQIGIFSLLQFRQLAPLLPLPVSGQANKVYISLYSIPQHSFDIEKLVRIYKVEKVYQAFLKMRGEYRESQDAFIKELERIMSIARKAAHGASLNNRVNDDRGMTMHSAGI